MNTKSDPVISAELMQIAKFEDLIVETARTIEIDEFTRVSAWVSQRLTDYCEYAEEAIND